MKLWEEYIFMGGHVMGGDSLEEGARYVVCEIHRGTACVTKTDNSMGYSISIRDVEEKLFKKC